MCVETDELGFTLRDLIVVAILFVVLIVVGLPLYNLHQRNVVLDTVKGDVSNNIQFMSPGMGGRKYVTQDKFVQFAVSTGDNTVGYLVGDDGSIACNQASHAFTSSDVASYHYLTSVGMVEKGACPTLESGEYAPAGAVAGQ